MGEPATRYCPRGKHKKWDRMPLDRVVAGGWACPGLLPDGTACGYELGTAAAVIAHPATAREALLALAADFESRKGPDRDDASVVWEMAAKMARDKAGKAAS